MCPLSVLQSVLFCAENTGHKAKMNSADEEQNYLWYVIVGAVRLLVITCPKKLDTKLTKLFGFVINFYRFIRLRQTFHVR